MEPTKYKYCIVESNFHLQITPKYRRDIFKEPVLMKECKKCFYEIAKRWNVGLEAVAFGPEHTHLFLTRCKNYSIPKLAQYFKGGSSRFLRKNFWDRIKSKLYGDSFWSDGYFAESIGRVTSESIKYYIERQQDKHWKHEDYEIYLRSHEDWDPAQSTLSDFLYC